MQPPEANDQIQRIDQALLALDQLVDQRASPATFCAALARVVQQILPGGQLWTVHWLGSSWLIEPIHTTTAQADRIAWRRWLDSLDERMDVEDYRAWHSQSTQTICLAARNSPRTAWGGLLWCKQGSLDESLTSAVFQLLSPLAELWECYWRSTTGQSLEKIRAAVTRGLQAWPQVPQTEERAYRLVNDLCLACSAERCAVTQVASWSSTSRLIAISGLADVKLQSQTLLQWLKSIHRSPIGQMQHADAPASSHWMSLPLDNHRRVTIEWSSADRYLASGPILSVLWPIITQAWLAQGRARNGLQLVSPRWSTTRAVTIGGLLLIALALWLTRNWPVTLYIECTGRLEPVEQAWCFAPADGHIQQVLVSDREMVQPGQLVALVVSPSLDLQLQSVSSELDTLQQKKLSLEVLLSESSSNTESGSRDARRMAGEVLDIDLRLQGLQQQRQLLIEERQKLEVRSRIAGRVIGNDLAQQLSQKPVRTGDYLFRIVDEQHDWHLELDLPERDLGHVQRAMAAAVEPLTFRFSIVGMPAHNYPATVTRMRSAVQMDEANGSAARLLADVRPADLKDIPIGTQVLARLDTGQHPWWFVLARPAIESLQRRGWL